VILKVGKFPESVLVETNSSVLYGANTRALAFDHLPPTSPKQRIAVFIQHLHGNIYLQCKKRLDKNLCIGIKIGPPAIHCCVAG
jgi:hypothetical protein